jgi:hypothetical protein
MSTQTVDVAACVAGYAARLHRVIGDGHHVASALGCWLLLALAGPASTGADRATLEDVLGCDADAAARAAAGLLGNPHPAVASAAAVWTAGGQPLSAEFARWQEGLPPEVARGAVPDQAGADAWTREHTFGLIDRFPVRITPAVHLVLATALATKVSWQTPFELAPAADLGADSSWSREVRTVLRAPKPRPGQPPGHTQFIAVSEDAGDVAVHAARARDGLLVVSVAADPAVPAGRVLAAAHRIACARATGAPVPRRSLADLPAGPGPAWVVRDDQPATGADSCTAVLPAWRASSTHDLKHAELGFPAAKDALAPGGDPWQARQAAMARYTRLGFEAAAVSGMAVALSMIRPARQRVAELRFGHPYAAVAVTTDGNGAAPAEAVQPGGWHGLPVFSAWVSEPAEAADDADDGQDAPSGRPV